jgi:opacity protein-like surface antigen
VRWLALLLFIPAFAARADANDWKGWYGGLGLGPAYARSSWFTDATFRPAIEPVEHSMRGGMLGGQVGYNFAAAGSFFVGAELGLYAADLEQHTESVRPDAPNRERITTIRNPFYATLRMGFAGSRTLVYVRGGYAHADIELQAINHQVGNIALWEGHANGWTVGTGFEVRVNPRWGVGLGYDYSRLKATNLETTNSGDVLVHADDFSARVHALLLRANYRF